MLRHMRYLSDLPNRALNSLGICRNGFKKVLKRLQNGFKNETIKQEDRLLLFRWDLNRADTKALRLRKGIKWT